MSLEPREGVDYLIDYYAVAGLERDISPEEARPILDQKLKEFHPDLLQGRAPEFIARGEQMAKLLNRTRAILQNDEARRLYDEMLSTWTGPISETGTPVVTTDFMLRSAFHGKSADEVEAVFAEQSQKAEELSGNSTARLEFIERLIAKAGGEIDDDLRNEYEEALALKDAMLAAQEAERSKLLGLPDIEASGFEARLGYAQAIHEEIETARERELTTLRVRALGGAGTRLALEAGESTDLVATPEQLDAITLPAYYEPQAEKVLELAKEREAIVEKRLANLITELPEEDLQQSFQQTLIIGARTQSGYIKWVACTFDDPDPNAEQKVSVDPIHEESRNQLREERYPQIIKNGCGILIFEYLSQIDYEDQVITAMSKYASRFTEVD